MSIERKMGLWGHTTTLINTTLSGATRTVTAGISTVANTVETTEVVTASLKSIVSQYSRAVEAQATHHTELWDIENQLERLESGNLLEQRKAQLAKLKGVANV